jgi:hypothetical protein
VLNSGVYIEGKLEIISHGNNNVLHLQRLDESLWLDVANFIYIDPLLNTSKVLMNGIDILKNMRSRSNASNVYTTAETHF